jgi:hypothetical protein
MRLAQPKSPSLNHAETLLDAQKGERNHQQYRNWFAIDRRTCQSICRSVMRFAKRAPLKCNSQQEGFPLFTTDDFVGKIATFAR